MMIPEPLRCGLLYLLTLVAMAAMAPVAQAMERGEVTVVTAAGSTHNFKVEVARTPAEQQRGLMHREVLPVDQGMLFPYSQPQPLSFWMKNTLIPLDIIFIGADGRIINIATAKPHDLTPVVSKRPGVAVLEINGGLAERLGIRSGDLVRYGHILHTR